MPHVKFLGVYDKVAYEEDFVHESSCRFSVPDTRVEKHKGMRCFDTRKTNFVPGVGKGN